MWTKGWSNYQVEQNLNRDYILDCYMDWLTVKKVIINTENGLDFPHPLTSAWFRKHLVEHSVVGLVLSALHPTATALPFSTWCQQKPKIKVSVIGPLKIKTYHIGNAFFLAPFAVDILRLNQMHHQINTNVGIQLSLIWRSDKSNPC